MPPHLHPRSTATSTLFAGTLLASFVVVGIPHLFPCPRPRRGYADTERQRQRSPEAEQPTPNTSSGQEPPSPQDSNLAMQRKNLSQRKAMSEEAALFAELQREADALEKEARECPVPKPRGLIGRILGFEDTTPASASTTAAEGGASLSSSSLRQGSSRNERAEVYHPTSITERVNSISRQFVHKELDFHTAPSMKQHKSG
ncbi:hypothetical protein LTR84_010112 [Exophiala bonariae]|uniref:Uncharacterized protein n=1 Tax=Exophiala bonariae TaxID=1690606 RepID=A0AAV9NK84_9EURO|nr:hypothetical protein LTR84_010112 [Exophiala bonariae]